MSDGTLGLLAEDRADVRKKIEDLLVPTEKQKKTFAWEMRSKIGPRKKWYTEVEEVIR